MGKNLALVYFFFNKTEPPCCVKSGIPWFFIAMWENELVVHQKMIWQAYYDKKKNKILPTVQKTAMLAFSKRRTNFYLYIQTTGRFPYIAVGRIFLQTHCYFIIVAVGVQNKGRGEVSNLGIQLKNICKNQHIEFK